MIPLIRMTAFSLHRDLFGSYKGETLIKSLYKGDVLDTHTAVDMNGRAHFLMLLLQQQLVRGSYSSLNLGNKTFGGR